MKKLNSKQQRLLEHLARLNQVKRFQKQMKTLDNILLVISIANIIVFIILLITNYIKNI